MFRVLASIEQNPLPLCDWINIGILVCVPFFAIVVAFVLHALRKDNTEQGDPFFPIQKFDITGAVAISVGFVALFSFSIFRTEAATAEALISSQLITALIMLPALITVSSHSAVPILRSNKAAWFMGGICSIYLFTFLLSSFGFFDLIHSEFNAPFEQNVLQAFQDAGIGVFDKVLFVVSAVVIAPILEETLFRGYFYPILRKYTNVPFAILFVSLFFGAVHLSLLHFIVLSFIGLVLNLVYEKTHSLRLCMAMHATYNAVSIVALYIGSLII